MLLTSAYVRIPSSNIMETAAKNFLSSLTSEQRAKATYKFDDDQRFDWHFIPKPRKGLPLKEMTSYQTKLAHALLSAGLSQRGYIKAVTIMSLEDVLKIMEKDAGERRNPDGYFFTIFGEPSSTGVWGYRVEGHHLSQNYTVVGGKVVDSPSFFGSNPAEVKQGPRKGTRVLAAEDDLGRVSSRAAEREIFLLLEDDDAGHLVVTFNEEDRAARPDAIRGREQFVNSRDADAFAWRRWKSWSLRKPRWNERARAWAAGSHCFARQGPYDRE